MSNYTVRKQTRCALKNKSTLQTQKIDKTLSLWKIYEFAQVFIHKIYIQTQTQHLEVAC